VGGGGERVGGRLGLGLRKFVFILVFFFKCWLIEPVRFGLVRFNRFQILETETEPNRNFFVIF
jgi:hypothetical protein